MSRHRNGQVFTADMVASVAIFLVLVNVALITVNMAERDATAFSTERAMADRAQRVADLLVRTGGYPENWTAETVEIPGLASPSHVLDTGKLDAFNDTSYVEQQSLLRARAADTILTVSRDGDTVTVDTSDGLLPLTFGKPVPDDAGTAVVERRRVTVNTSNTAGRVSAQLRLVYWQ